MMREFSPIPISPESTQAPPSLPPRPRSSGSHQSFDFTLRQLGSALAAPPQVEPAHGAKPGVGGYSTVELLALQVQVYRYTEAIDLVAKLVDRTTTAVRTTLQNSA